VLSALAGGVTVGSAVSDHTDSGVKGERAAFELNRGRLLLLLLAAARHHRRRCAAPECCPASSDHHTPLSALHCTALLGCSALPPSALNGTKGKGRQNKKEKREKGTKKAGSTRRSRRIRSMTLT